MDLVPLITLGRYFEQLIKEANQQFKSIFTAKETPPDFNPEFLLAWQASGTRCILSSLIHIHGY